MSRRSPFNVSGTQIPGQTTGVGGKTATYPMPALGSLPTTGLRPSPDPRLRGKRARTQSRTGFARDAAGAFPPGKRPRGEAVPPGARPTAYSGRGITPSFLMSAVTAANRAEATWETGDRTKDFSSYQRLVVADKSSLSFALMLKGQLVFNDRLGFQESGRGIISATRHRLGGRLVPGDGGIRVSQGISRLLPLPALNYFLRQDDDYGTNGWMTPEQVIGRYALDGVVRTDAHESQHPSYRNTDVKEYTVTISGRDPDTTNIWGLVRQMQPLYLLVKRIRADQAPREYTLSPQDGIRRVVPPAGGDGRFHPNPLQVIPWSDPIKRHPTANDLRYFDEADQCWKFGIAICVGWANYSSDVADSRALTSTWYDANTLMTLPRVDITVNMRRKGF